MAFRRKVWIGLVGVESHPGNDLLGDARGAYVNVVTLASSVSDYTDRVRAAVNELGLRLTEIENPEPLSRRTAKYAVNEEILTMANTARKLDSVTFGTFYPYEDNEED